MLSRCLLVVAKPLVHYMRWKHLIQFGSPSRAAKCKKCGQVRFDYTFEHRDGWPNSNIAEEGLKKKAKAKSQAESKLRDVPAESSQSKPPKDEAARFTNG